METPATSRVVTYKSDIRNPRDLQSAPPRVWQQKRITLHDTMRVTYDIWRVDTALFKLSDPANFSGHQNNHSTAFDFFFSFCLARFPPNHERTPRHTILSFVNIYYCAPLHHSAKWKLRGMYNWLIRIIIQEKLYEVKTVQEPLAMREKCIKYLQESVIIWWVVWGFSL